MGRIESTDQLVQPEKTSMRPLSKLRILQLLDLHNHKGDFEWANVCRPVYSRLLGIRAIESSRHENLPAPYPTQIICLMEALDNPLLSGSVRFRIQEGPKEPCILPLSLKTTFLLHKLTTHISLT